MVVITFPDKETQTKARGFLLRRFSGKVFKSGEHVFPEAAMTAIAEANIPFMVHGKASYEKCMERRPMKNKSRRFEVLLLAK